MGVCDRTDIFANDVICDVTKQLDKVYDLAVSFKDQAIAYINAIQTSAESNIATIAGQQYSLNLTGIDFSFNSDLGVDPQAPDVEGYAPPLPEPLQLSPDKALPVDPDTTPPTFPIDYQHQDYAGPEDGTPNDHSGQTYDVDAYAGVGTHPIDSHDLSPHAVAPSPWSGGEHEVGAPPSIDPHAVDVPPEIPVAYTVPPASTMLISQSVFNDIFNRRAGDLSRISVADERDAQYQASAMGLGMMSAALAKRLAKAKTEKNMRISEASRDGVIQEGEWLRDDVKTLHGLHIQNWPLKPQLDVDAWGRKETLDLEAYKTENSLEVELFGTVESARVQGYTATVNALVASYRAEEELKLDAFKAYEGIRADVYKAFEQYELSVYETAERLKTEIYRTEQGLSVDVFKTVEGVNVDAYKTKEGSLLGYYNTKEQIKHDAHQGDSGIKSDWAKHAQTHAREVYRIQSDLNQRTFSTRVGAITALYATEIQALSSRYGQTIQWVNSHIANLVQRYATTVDYYRASIAKEGERRQWSALELSSRFEDADKTTAYALQQINLILQVVDETQKAFAQSMVGLAQSAFAASDYSLQGSGSQNVSENISS